MGKGIESDAPLGTASCGCSPGPWPREAGVSGPSANSAASSVGAKVAPSDARLVTGVGMEENHSRKKRAVKSAVVAVVVVVGVGWRKAGGDQLGSCPCPASKDHLRLGSYRVHRCRFEPGRTNRCERRRPAPGSRRSSNLSCRVFQVRGSATFP